MRIGSGKMADMSHPRVSVILSIFDQPRAFDLSLTGYRKQSFRDFELVVADDGSDHEIVDLIRKHQPGFAHPIKHIRQVNKGYRRSKIANKAFLQCAGDAIVLSDGDCIPHHAFVQTHAEAIRPGSFTVAGYLRLSYEQSMAMTPEGVVNRVHERMLTPWMRFKFTLRHWANRYYIAVRKRRRPKAYGANIGVDREVYRAVNGYDENFDGFGKEDSDLRNRLVASGARPISLWNRAFVFHLDHAIDTKRVRQTGKARIKNKDYYYRDDVPTRCPNGIVKEGTYAGQENDE